MYSHGRIPSDSPSGETYNPAFRLYHGLPMTSDQIAVFESLEAGLELVIVADVLCMHELGVGVTVIDRQGAQMRTKVNPWIHHSMGTFLEMTRQA